MALMVGFVMVGMSKMIRMNILQNVVLAVVLKLVVGVLAACGVAQLWMAVAADVGSLLLVIMNGTRPLGLLHCGVKPKEKSLPTAKSYGTFADEVV